MAPHVGPCAQAPLNLSEIYLLAWPKNSIMLTMEPYLQLLYAVLTNYIVTK